jgi:hypothetical protein
MHAVAEGVKICIVVCEPAEKCERGMPIARQIDAPRTASAGLLGAVARIECERVLLA